MNSIIIHFVFRTPTQTHTSYTFLHIIFGFVHCIYLTNKYFLDFCILDLLILNSSDALTTNSFLPSFSPSFKSTNVFLPSSVGPNWFAAITFWSFVCNSRCFRMKYTSSSKYLDDGKHHSSTKPFSTNANSICLVLWLSFSDSSIFKQKSSKS